MLNLQFDEASKQLTDQEPATRYLRSLCNALELLLNEDAEKLESYQRELEESIAAFVSLKKQSAELHYFQTELTLYWAFIHLKFGHEFDAALSLRKAYQLATSGRKKYPHFVPLLKSNGLLQIIMGSVPEKYAWVLSLMNMEGNIQNGMKQLQTAAHPTSEVELEAKLLLSAIHGYVMQQSTEAIQEIESILTQQPKQNLTLFMGASLALKNAQAEKAIELLNLLNETNLPSIYYFRGEALLCKGEYALAVKEFLSYISSFKGKNFIKDAYFKTGLCFQLLNENAKASDYFALARQHGNENTEADKYAHRTLTSNESINSSLFKIRFFTDGGYYEKALTTIRSISPSDIPTKKEQVEFYYRQARLAHKTNQPNTAKLYYEQCIAMSDDSPWYFAPNSCLQLGYILQNEGKNGQARSYFEKALTYKKHEYKNSIDTKAKSALNQDIKAK